MARACTGAQDISELDFVLVLRVLRLIRILNRHPGYVHLSLSLPMTFLICFKRLKLILDTLAQLGPAILTYGTVVLSLYYCFAILGMELFGGLIQEVCQLGYLRCGCVTCLLCRATNQ